MRTFLWILWENKWKKHITFHSLIRVKEKFIPSNWGIKGNLKSLPYDKMDKKLKKGIEVVEDVNDALKKVRTLNKIQIKNKLKYGRNIYKKYISPNSFYKFIKANLND